MLRLRTIAERLARNRSFKRALPKQFNSTALFVSPDAQLKYLRRGVIGFDSGLLAHAEEFCGPDKKVWDIGSNVGVFAFAAAGRSAEVLAVEPDPWLASLLRSSQRLYANRNLKLRILSAAVADRNGIADLLIAERGRASNALVEAGGNENMGGCREIISVPTVTLDTLLAECGAPNIVKMDVEGAEALALSGAKKVLRDARPIWLIEVNSTNVQAATAIFKKSGYDLYDADKPSANRVPLDACVFNTLAVPQRNYAGARLDS